MKSLELSDVWISDLDFAISKMDISALKGRSVLVTGATGLICSVVVDMLIRYNEVHDGSVEIYAAGRRLEKITERFGEYSAKPYFHFVQYDALEEIQSFSERAEYIIHGAGNAYPDAFMKEPVETMVLNFTGTLRLLEYGRNHGCKRFLYVSSSEVYGKKEHKGSFFEDDYGFVDLLKSRSAYPVGKRAGETLTASFSEEYDFDATIVRPGHVYGPTASRADNRVSSCFAYDAAEGRDIVLKSAGTQIRSYVYCADCASAILTVLLKGERGKAYNISNPDSVISIKQMSEILAGAGGVNLRFETPDISEQKAFNPMNDSSLDSARLESLGWRGIFGAKEGLTHTVQILADVYA